MIQGDTTAVIAGASAIGGGLIVAASNYAISRAQAWDARRDALAGLLSELGHAISRVEQQLRLEPKPGKTVRAYNETMDTRMPMLYHTIGQIRRRLLEPELTEMSVALSKALSAATVMAPREMLPVLGTLAELMGETRPPVGRLVVEVGKGAIGLLRPVAQLARLQQPTPLDCPA